MSERQYKKQVIISTTTFYKLVKQCFLTFHIYIYIFLWEKIERTIVIESIVCDKRENSSHESYKDNTVKGLFF